MTEYIVMDANNLCHRSWHARYGMSKYRSEQAIKDKFNITAYGLVSDLIFLGQIFDVRNCIFCWDHPINLRKQNYPEYKANRVFDDAKRTLDNQMRDCRDFFLPELGINKQLYSEGYEADDYIALVCNSLKEGDTAIIVSCDSDLYQLLKNKKIQIWNPITKYCMTEEWFVEEYKLKPSQWPSVKAITGCKVDNVGGVEGVGSVYAGRLLRGESLTKRIADKIEKSQELIQRNKDLVSLPYSKLKQVDINLKTENTPSLESWRKTLTKYKLTNFLGKYPFREGI